MDRINIPIQRYPNPPNVGELLAVTILDLDTNTGAHFECLEYPKLTGLIGLNDLTRQRRVKSYRRLCPPGSQKVVELLEISQYTGELQGSLKTVDASDTQRILDRLNQNTKLIRMVYKYCHDHQCDPQQMYSDIVWPLLDGDQHPYDLLANPTYLSAHSGNYLTDLLTQHSRYFGEIIHESNISLQLTFGGWNALKQIQEILRLMNQPFENPSGAGASRSDFEVQMVIETAPHYLLIVRHEDHEQLQNVVERELTRLRELIAGIQGATLKVLDENHQK